MAIVSSAPARAATNPYTPQSACANDFGGSWSSTTDGHRSVLTPTGAKWGDVYLMYNSATGYNCVATIKSAYVGTASYTFASIMVQGVAQWYSEARYLKYYAAVQRPAGGKCVQYDAGIMNPTDSGSASGGRHTWGNCG
ncbi:hypothetical protein ACFY05_43350 [Microtetraspora fusca]|uniref:Spore-associated protein A n=1 Tax=Microtetraspora fusca TaxID=1997 RepID=A0ABW6VKN9_MICFU